MGPADPKVDLAVVKSIDYLYRSRHIFPQKIKWHIYHGNQRRRNIFEVMNYDVVLTTYDAVGGDESQRPNSSSDEAKVLHACEWHRVVLDEGKRDERRKLFTNSFAKSSSQPTLYAMPRQSDIVL